MTRAFKQAQEGESRRDVKDGLRGPLVRDTERRTDILLDEPLYLTPKDRVAIREDRLVPKNGTATEVALRKVAMEIAGNGSTQTFTVQHDLGTRDLVLSLHEKDPPYEFRGITMRADLQTLTVLFGSPPGVGEDYIVTAVG